jgi:hypothetical protein
MSINKDDNIVEKFKIFRTNYTNAVATYYVMGFLDRINFENIKQPGTNYDGFRD